MGARDLEKWWRANRLHEFLWIKYLKEKWEYGVAYNLGIDWDTSTGILKRFDTEAEAREPNIIMIAIGSNDCIYKEGRNYSTPTDIFRKNITAIIEKAKKYTEQVIIIGMIPCDENKTTPIPRVPERSQDREWTMMYNAILQEIAQEKKVEFIDMFNVIDNEDLEEGSHPTAQGHEKIFIRIKNFLVENNIIE
jgi:lysophospholipase L1-like esterase